MAKQTDDNVGEKQKNDNEQKSNVFIVDKNENSVKAVSEITPEGEVKTVPANRANQASFLEVGVNNDPIDIVETVIKNFWTQAKNPTDITILNVPRHVLENTKDFFKLLSDQLKPVISNASKKFSETFLVNPAKFLLNLQKQNQMAKQKNNEEIGEKNTDRKYRFLPSTVKWDELSKMGLSKELLEKKGMLEPLLMGNRTDLVKVNMVVGGAKVSIDAKLSLQTQDDGFVGFRVIGVKNAPEFDRPYFGHVFSPEDKENLLKTGNMGRVVTLNRNGENVESYISLDKQTNTFAAVRANSVKIKPEYGGIKLEQHEIDTLKEGKPLFLEGMTSQKGKAFDATLQVDAFKFGVGFSFNNGVDNIKKLGGVELTEQQQKDLVEGKAIKVEGMKSNYSDDLRDSFVRWDDAAGKLQFTNFNPDSEEGNREVIIPRYVYGVELTEEDQKTLATGQSVFLKGMTVGGNERDAFVSLHPENGNVRLSNSPDKFDETVKYEIPKVIRGVKITAATRAAIQDGKTVEIKNAKDLEGKPVTTFVKINNSTGTLSFYNENPDKKQTNSKTAVIGNGNKNEETTSKPAIKPEKKAKKTSSNKIS